MGISEGGATVADSVAAERIRKVFAKNVAILGLGKTESDDPQSALYRQIRTVDDLDRITKDF
jgi:hypothetical protein